MNQSFINRFVINYHLHGFLVLFQTIRQKFMDSFKAIKLLWGLIVLVISSQAYFIPEKESEFIVNLLVVTPGNRKQLNINNFQEQTISENPKRYKRWGWNPLPYFTQTFENVPYDVNKAISSVQNVVVTVKTNAENAIDVVDRTAKDAIDVVQRTGGEAVDKINAVKTKAEGAIEVVDRTGKDAIDFVHRTGEEAIDKINIVKTNAENVIDVVDSTGKDAIDVLQRTGEEAIIKITNTSKTVYSTVYGTGKCIVEGIDGLAAGSINVIYINSEQMTAVISKNVIEPFRSQAAIIINDRGTMNLISNAVFEGSCALIGTLTGVAGAIPTGVICELIRQINNEGIYSVIDKIKNGDIKFISKLILKGACGGIAVQVGLVGGLAAGEVCTIVEIVIDNDEVLRDPKRFVLEVGLGGACGGLGSLGKAAGAAIAAAGCSVVNNLNDQGKAIEIN